MNDFNTLKAQIAKIPLEYRNAKNKFHFHGFDENHIARSYISSMIDNLQQLYSEDLENSIKAR